MAETDQLADIRAWGSEVLQRYGWVPKGPDLECPGCGALGRACEIFSAGVPFHAPGTPAARTCPAQAGRRQLYRTEWCRFAREIAEVAAIPLDLARLVWGFAPTFGFVLRRAALLGPLAGRVGNHTRCDLCRGRALWTPEAGSGARLASLANRCERINAIETERLLVGVAGPLALPPPFCGRCWRPMAPLFQKFPCRECSGAGAGLRCRCVRVVWHSCSSCLVAIVPPALVLGAPRLWRAKPPAEPPAQKAPRALRGTPDEG